MTERVWLLPEELPPDADQALAAFPRLLRQVLFRRGVRTERQAREFLAGAPGQEADPFQLTDMQPAVDRLTQALHSQEVVCVYGDYDTDGVTATALLVSYLRDLGAQVIDYIPDRFTHGYGLHAEALPAIQAQGASVVITVDCGIRGLEAAQAARRLGMDLIISDHHLPGAEMPAALAVINPNQSGDTYPYKHLAGVGLAFKLAQALATRLDGPSPADWLDLVAVGTVADVAPLTGENRSLVSRGLERLNVAPQQGLRALIEVSGHALGKLNATSIGFGLGPRLNAAGRLKHADLALDLLLEQERTRAMNMARELNALNRRRQRLTARTVERAEALVAPEDEGTPIIFAADGSFDQGVVGLAATRLAERYYRPAIVARQDGGLTRGSARSVPEVHITNLFEACADLLLSYGGHAAAAGFTVRTRDLDALRRRLGQELVRRLDGMALQPKLEIDAEARFSELDESALADMEALEPCGHQNPAPVLMTRRARLLQHRRVGGDGRHLKLTMQADDRWFDAIAFRQGDKAESLRPWLDVAFHLERNEYRGIESLQLNVLDLRPAT